MELVGPGQGVVDQAAFHCLFLQLCVHLQSTVMLCFNSGLVLLNSLLPIISSFVSDRGYQEFSDILRILAISDNGDIKHLLISILICI